MSLPRSIPRLQVALLCICACAVAACLLTPHSARAQVADALTTTNAAGDWFAPAVWSGGNVPDTTSIGTFDTFVTDGATISLSSGNGSIYQSLRVGALGNGTLTINGGTLITHSGVNTVNPVDLTTSNTIGGQDGIGTIIVNDPDSYLEFQGGNTIFGHNYPGGSGDRNGTLELSAGTVFFNGSQAGSQVQLANNNGREGFITMSGGIMSTNATTQLRIGAGGSTDGVGIFTMTGGSFLAPADANNEGGDSVHVGRGASTAQWNISGTAFVNLANDLQVGATADSADNDNLVSLSGGTLVTSDLFIGNNDDNSGGRVEVSGGSLLVSGNLVVGNEGDIVGGLSSFTQSGGVVHVDQSLRVGRNGATGVLTITDGLMIVGDDSSGPTTGNRQIVVGFSDSGAGVTTTNSVGTLTMTGGTLFYAETSDNGGNDIRIGRTDNGQGSASGHMIIAGDAVFTMNGFGDGIADGSQQVVLGNSGDNANGPQTATGRLEIRDDARVYLGSDLNIDTDADTAANSVLEVAGGSLLVDGQINLGNNAVASSVSTWVMSGGFVTNGLDVTNDDISIGQNANAILTMSGGTIISSDDFRIGHNLPAVGSAVITGGHIIGTDDFQVGNNAAGNLIVSGGTVTATDDFQIANNAGSTGSVAVTGGLAVAGDLFLVGNNGTGAILVSGGIVTANTDFRTGNNAGSTGTAIITGGLVIAGDDIVTGSGGTGSILVSGGTVTATDAFQVGQNAGSTGSATVTGTGLVLANGNVQVGNNGTGSMLVSGGTVIAGDDFQVANSAGSMGSLSVTGGLVSVTGDDLVVANSPDAIGVAHFSGGTVQITDLLNMAVGTFSNGSVTISGNAFVQAGIGTTTGGLRVASQATASSTATFLMTGGTLEVDRIDVDDGGSANSNHDFAGGVVHALSIINGGTGSIQLEANGVTNQLNVTGSTFDLQGGGITDNNGATNVILVSGGHIFNTADLDADIDLDGGSIRPGEDGAARVTDLDTGAANGEANDLDADGGMVIFDLFSDPAAVGNPIGTDASGLSGDVIDIAAPVDIVITSLVSLTFDLGDEFDLLDFTTFLGTGGTFDFSGAPLTGPLAWSTDRWLTEGVIHIIPEPAAPLLLLLTIFLGLTRRRRRRR